MICCRGCKAGSSKHRAIPCPGSEDALRTLLEAAGVDTTRFGEGNAKPLGTLFRELREGSCSLQKDRATGRVFRQVEPVFVQLTYDSTVLVERTQILANGNRRERNSLLAEKREDMDSDPVRTALRGIWEELHVDACLECEGLVHCQKDDVTLTETMDSPSYPGIKSVYLTHYVHLDIIKDSAAEKSFSECGLPDCSCFETEELKPEGTISFCWEWMHMDEARKEGIKGLIDNLPFKHNSRVSSVGPVHGGE